MLYVYKLFKLLKEFDQNHNKLTIFVYILKIKLLKRSCVKFMKLKKMTISH